NYRSKDPIHNISILGDSSIIETLNHFDTFGESGIYSYLSKENTYVINIDTEHFVSTFLHYLENKTQVPYKDFERTSYTGYLIEKSHISEIHSKNHFYKLKTSMNRSKIEKFLKNQKLITYKKSGGHHVSVVKVEEMIKT